MASTSEEPNSPSSDERGTPRHLIRALITALGGLFELDPCSGAEPIPIGNTRYTRFDDGLTKSWQGHETVWVNPPYSDLYSWMEKAWREFSSDSPAAPDLILALVPANTTADWFHDYGIRADYLTFLDARLRFNGLDSDPRFGNILLTFGEPPAPVKEALQQEGTVIAHEEIESTDRQTRLHSLIDEDSKSLPEPPTDLRDLHIGSTIELSLKGALMGQSTTSIPNTLSLRILSGGPAKPGDQFEIENYRTIFGINDDTETYAVVYQDPDDFDTMYASLAPGGRNWTDVAVTSIEVIGGGAEVAAIEPHGPGTSYIS